MVLTWSVDVAAEIACAKVVFRQEGNEREGEDIKKTPGMVLAWSVDVTAKIACAKVVFRQRAMDANT